MGLDINLHPKQLQALTSPANEILYGGAVGGGKALHIDTEIPTPNGWTTMGEISVGDKVFDKEGKPCNVIAKSELNPKAEAYKIVFDKKEYKTVIADKNHQWIIGDRIVRTEQLRIGSSVYAVPEYVQYKHKELPLNPYILGVFLAGGTVTNEVSGTISLSPETAVSGLSLESYEDGSYVYLEKWNALLASMGLPSNPAEGHIPEIYKTASREQRMELMRGFFDIRGTIYSNRCNYKEVHNQIGQVEIYLKSKRIMEDVQEVLSSLGENAHMYKRTDREGTPRTHLIYRIRFMSKNVYFNVTDKLTKSTHIRALQKYKNPKIHRITSIEKLSEPQPVQCIEVDSPSKSYLITRSYIATHNSHLLRIASIIWAMECPGIQIYLFRLTRKELDDNHMVGSGGYFDLLADAVNNKYVKINNTKHEIQFRNGYNNTFMNGSVIHLCHCQHEDDKYLYQGAEMSVLMIDEATHFTWSKYSYLRTRVRIPKNWNPPEEFTKKWGKNFFPRILLATNPGGISHLHLRREFVKIAPPETIVRMPKDKGGMRRQFIPAKLADNPSIDKDEYEGRVMSVGNAAVAQMLLEGDWDAVAGGMFEDVWDDKVHMIEPFTIPDSWYVDRTFDWGYTDPFSVGWWAQSDGTPVELDDGSIVTYPKGSLFRIAEWYGWTGEENVGIGLTAHEIGEGIKRIEETDPVFRTIDRVYPGPSDWQIWNNSPKQDSSYKSLIHELNAGYYGNDNYMLFNIFTKADKTAGSRVRGWNILRGHLKNSLKFPKIDKECLFIFNTCPTPRRIIPTTIRDELKVEDIAPKQEDHVLDEMRYRLQHTIVRTRRVSTRMG